MTFCKKLYLCCIHGYCSGGASPQKSRSATPDPPEAELNPFAEFLLAAAEAAPTSPTATPKKTVNGGAAAAAAATPPNTEAAGIDVFATDDQFSQVGLENNKNRITTTNNNY